MAGTVLGMRPCVNALNSIASDMEGKKYADRRIDMKSSHFIRKGCQKRNAKINSTPESKFCLAWILKFSVLRVSNTNEKDL